MLASAKVGTQCPSKQNGLWHYQTTILLFCSCWHHFLPIQMGKRAGVWKEVRPKTVPSLPSWETVAAGVC